jgi:hypothetical protein
MSRRSPSPDVGDSSDEEVVDEGAKKQSSVASKKIWSWLHIAVSTGNIEKVVSTDSMVPIFRSKH